mgnify:FL=1
MKFKSGDQISVVLSMPIGGTYDYTVPNGVEVVPGNIVEVPFRSSYKLGIVWGQGLNKISKDKLRSVRNKKEGYLISPENISFIDWMSEYTVQSKGLIVNATIKDFSDKNYNVKAYKLSPKNLNKIKVTDQRKKIIDLMKGEEVLLKSEILELSKSSSAVLNGLIKKNILIPVTKEIDLGFVKKNLSVSELKLNQEQEKAAIDLRKMIGKGFDVALLEGVTGSGKTEVYFEQILVALKKNLQVLVLVPEISITTQWLGRFQSKFGFLPHIWHSSISKRIRSNVWKKIIKGETNVVVGARSALFLPFKNLGLVVVDEEHDNSFKQEERLIYHARDMAVVRAKEENIPIVLVSATPSIETVMNVREGRYKYFSIKNRFGEALMPRIQIVDLLSNPPNQQAWGRTWLSEPLIKAVSSNLDNKEQVFLFLNRRGYAPISICKNCGFKLSCPSCSAWLVEHRSDSSLQCHHCGFKRKHPHKCPSCLKEDGFISFGPGIERVYEDVTKRWPKARVGLIASDYFDDQKNLSNFISSIEKKEIDIIIGTQLLAKGHHFPNLTLVGIIDADMGLSVWDLRGSEKVYQMMYQVSGRAGRGDKAGKVILQSHECSNHIFQALSENQNDLFLNKEIDFRRELKMPPFGRLISIIISGTEEKEVIKFTEVMNKTKPKNDNIQIFGPAPAVMTRLRGKYRYRFLVKGPKNLLLQPFVKRWIDLTNKTNLIRVQVDVDPYSFY